MCLGVANPSKSKGDRAELEAVEHLVAAIPDLVNDRPMRKLGAGRKEDTGDLSVLDDVAIQVRNYDLKSIGQAVRTAARDAVDQAANGDLSFALGMVPYPRARTGTVRWLAAVMTMPGDPVIDTIEFKQVSRALTWLRDDNGPHGYLPYPREERIAQLTNVPGQALLLAPLEAWLTHYNALHNTDDVVVQMRSA